MGEMGGAEGGRCWLSEDMIDTAGTVAKGAEALQAQGAGPIYAAATHAIFSRKARQLREGSPTQGVVVTNTVRIPEERQLDKLQVRSIAPLIAMALRAVFDDSSV